MKILWFTNNACSASKIYSPKSFQGGWLASLENQLNKNPDVKLFISFYHNKPTVPFDYNNSRYYPVLKEKKLKCKIIERVFNRFNNNIELEINRLVDVVKEVNPDIIHIHGTEENFGLIQKLVAQPVVISMQGIINPICEKFFSGMPRAVVKKYEPLRLKFSFHSQLYRYKRFMAMAKNELEILNISKSIIGRTDWDRRVTSVLSPNRKYYHNDELLRDTIYKNNWNSDCYLSNEFKIITITGSPLFKGFETIIKTAGILQKLQEIKFEWNIVGLSEDDPGVKMMVSWMNVNLKDVNIYFLGKIPPEKFIPLMQNSNVYCQASHIENSPNSLCEAMYIGMPVVATFAGGTESMLENNKEGLLVQDGDPYSMAGAIMELKNNPEKAKQLAHNARQRALLRHDPDKVVRELLTIYKDITGKD